MEVELTTAIDSIVKTRWDYPNMVQSGNMVVRQIDLSEEQILRPEKCRACSLNE
jgi:hypothetical protein